MEKQKQMKQMAMKLDKIDFESNLDDEEQFEEENKLKRKISSWRLEEQA